MELRLRQLSKEFQEMELAQMKKGELSARKKLEKAKGWVDGTRTEFESTLRRARKASDQAWDDISETLREAWTEMKESVERARAEFEGEDTAES